MQVKKTDSTETEVKFSVIANANEMSSMKEHVLGHFKNRVKVPGFRAGKVPGAILEKHIDPNALQTEFLEDAIEQMYAQAVGELNIRPVGQPNVAIKKFVPFTELEFEVEVPVVGEIKLPDYTKIKKTAPAVTVSDKDIEDVINSLKVRSAEKKDVNREAKAGDQVWIDFSGTDASGKPVNGAEGKDYPLLLGSNTFIPGFENNLIGVKAGEDKTFTLTFPKDYGVKALANKKVTFKVSVTKVQEVIEPKVDDAFAAQVGPFKSLKELKEDIKRQLAHERQHEAQTDFESQLIREITAKSKLSAPKVLVEDQIERMLREVQQNLMYRGQTFPEFLEQEGKTEESYRKELEPQAEERIKASLVLSEIAEKEKIDVTPEELEGRMQMLKGQYKDAQMQTELDKPEARRDIASRIMTEKTIKKLVSYATK